MTSERTISETNSVFEQPWWLDTVAEGKWQEAAVREEDSGRILARLPYVVERGRISMPRYTQTLGIWMAPELRAPKRGNEHLGRQKEVIHALLRELPVRNRIDLVLDSSQEYVLPFRWEKFSIEPAFSYRIVFGEAWDDCEQNFTKNIQRDIRRGLKTLTVTESDDIEEFLRLQNRSYERQNRKNPIDNDFTAHVIERAAGLSHGKLFAARDAGGHAHAGSFVLYDEKCCYHLMSGQDTSYGNDGALPILFREEIAFAKAHSLAYDFEGSMVEGIEQTYRRYGGKLVTNWHVWRQPLLSDLARTMKPRVKRLIGYKM